MPYTRDATAPQLRPQAHPAEPRPSGPRERAAVRAPLQIVEPSRRRRSIGLLVAGLCALIFMGLLGLTAVQVTLAQNQQRLDKVNREVQQARDYYDRLRLAVAKLQSPDYIVPSATKRLGMVPAASPLYLTPTAGVVNQVAAATGETISGAGSGTGAGRPEWGEVKESLGQLP
jgi:cell division protein FtsB